MINETARVGRLFLDRNLAMLGPNQIDGGQVSNGSGSTKAILQDPKGNSG